VTLGLSHDPLEIGLHTPKLLLDSTVLAPAAGLSSNPFKSVVRFTSLRMRSVDGVDGVQRLMFNLGRAVSDQEAAEWWVVCSQVWLCTANSIEQQ
jgi:hypothetical protein